MTFGCCVLLACQEESPLPVLTHVCKRREGERDKSE